MKTSILESDAGTQLGKAQDTIEEQNLSCEWDRTFSKRHSLIL